MLVRILEKARERIAKRNYVYVIGMRVPKTGDVCRNDRQGKNNADVDKERGDEKLRFVGSRQAATEYSRSRQRLRD